MLELKEPYACSYHAKRQTRSHATGMNAGMSPNKRSPLQRCQTEGDEQQVAYAKDLFSRGYITLAQSGGSRKATDSSDTTEPSRHYRHPSSLYRALMQRSSRQVSTSGTMLLCA